MKLLDQAFNTPPFYKPTETCYDFTMRNNAIETLLTRRVEKVLPTKDGLAKLLSKKKIRLYLGVDPTSPDLHLGHTLTLRKLREFEDMGHETILLFGTFTAQIGDPSGRDEQRKPLSAKEVVVNMKTYQKQAGMILNFKKTKIRYNGDWLSKLTFKELLQIASNFTTSQLLERDMFEKRIKAGGGVWVHEFLYPLMQGYDSVATDVDLEIGATDQTFNMLVGRKLQKVYHNKEKFVLTTPLLPGLDGRKMSKTYGNSVNILDAPKDMYGKLMTLRDELVPSYFELCTDVSLVEVKKLGKALSPRDFKARLAREIVAMYHSKKDAAKAEREFIRVFREKEQPSEVPGVRFKEKKLPLLELLLKAKLVSSKSEARRVILQGGVKVDGTVQKSWDISIALRKGILIQVGKRRFVRII